MNQGNPPPNWYPDPKGEAELRYWDGGQWTEHTHSGQSAAAPAPAAPPPSTAPPPQSPPPMASQATAAGGYPQQGGYGTAPAGGPAESGGGLGKRLPLIVGAVLAVVAIGVVLALVLGGGDDAPSEADRAKDAAEEIITTKDTSACTELATRDFLQKATGESGAAAVSACEEDTSEPFGDSAEIEEPEVTGDKATVEAKLEGGQLDGETIELELVKEGEDWKMDELARESLLEGSKAESTLINTVLNFGSSEGPKACEYLSYTGLQRLGGKSGCEKEFANATAANYTPQDVNIQGKTATVVVEETRQNKTIQFKVAHEAGNWKIESFQQQ
ncbi:MAG TPA: DUF2510 domain-containing protein [Thermoleophilaceae bacterium]|jgi:hypothetical protein